MKRKFELGQTVYWVFNVWGYEIPKLVEGKVNEIRILEKYEKEDILDYSLSSYFYEDGSKWYIDRDKAGKALAITLEEEIIKSETKITAMKEKLEACKMLYDIED